MITLSLQSAPAACSSIAILLQCQLSYAPTTVDDKRQRCRQLMVTNILTKHECTTRHAIPGMKKLHPKLMPSNLLQHCGMPSTLMTDCPWHGITTAANPGDHSKLQCVAMAIQINWYHQIGGTPTGSNHVTVEAIACIDKAEASGQQPLNV